MELETNLLSQFRTLPRTLRLQVAEYVEFLAQRHNPSAERVQEDKNRQAAVQILQMIADNGGLGIKDPQAWQREMRVDRPLPYRDN